MFQLYSILAQRVGTTRARALAHRLTSWHDAMVVHERHTRRRRPQPGCGDDCPHEDAVDLWWEARQVLGDAAQQLTFLRSRAAGTGRRSADVSGNGGAR
jgi:hypothetical protein